MTQRSVGRSRICRMLTATGLYAFLSVVLLWPTLKSESLYSTLPTGPTQVGTVPFFNTWTIWWNAHQAAQGFRNYWHAPIFYPATGTFAFSEPQPATLIVAPIVWMSGSPILAYKIYLLISLVLNGLLARRLFHRLRISSALSVVGGAVVVLLPIIHQQIDVLQLIPVWGILWTWVAFDAFCQRPAFTRALWAGLAFSISFWLSIHHGLFLSVVLCGPVLVLPRRWKSLRLPGFAMVALAVALMMILPLILPIRRYLQQENFERSDRTIAALSATAIDYLQAPSNAWITGPRHDAAKRELLVGWLKLALAVAGVCYGLKRRRTRRLTGFLLLTAGLALTLSLGMHLKFGDWSLWDFLCRVIPGLAYVRSVFRFAYFVQLVLAILAVVGLEFLRQTGLHRCRHPRLRQLITTGILAAGGLAMLETPPARIILVGVPGQAANARWTTYVRQHLSPGRSLLCLPFAPGLTVRDLDTSSRWMYLQTFHGQPMVNGYSGFFPQFWFQLQAALMKERQKPAPPLAQLLRQGNVELVVVQNGNEDISWLRIRLAFQATLEPGLIDEHGVIVYHLRWLTPAASNPG